MPKSLLLLSPSGHLADHARRWFDVRQPKGADIIAGDNIDMILSFKWPYILPAEQIDAVGGLAFNIHAAPLPQYRGYNAASHAILNGEQQFGVTAHWMVSEVDAGDIIITRPVPIRPNDTAHSLHGRANRLALELACRLVDMLAGGVKIPRTPQRGISQFYPKKMSREIDAGGDIIRQARAFWFPPHVGYVRLGGRKMAIVPRPHFLDNVHNTA